MPNKGRGGVMSNVLGGNRLTQHAAQHHCWDYFLQYDRCWMNGYHGSRKSELRKAIKSSFSEAFIESPLMYHVTVPCGGGGS